MYVMNIVLKCKIINIGSLFFIKENEMHKKINGYCLKYLYKITKTHFFFN